MNLKLLKTHEEAARLLGKVKDDVKQYLSEKKSLNEKKVIKFVRKQFRKYNLKTDKDCPIVAFGKNTSLIHYFPGKKSEPLRPETPILLDMWAHLPFGVYADITWMFYYGHKPKQEFLDVFDAVIGSRDALVTYLKHAFQDNKIPISNVCDAVVRDYLNKKGYGAYFFHSTGHSMTQRLVHGLKSNKGFSPRNDLKMKKRLPYTIEPGLYFAHLDEPFGVRSEIDFYSNEKNELVLTSPVQKEMDYILPKGQSTLRKF